MEFRYYFLKEKNRDYEKPELITYLTNSPNVTIPSGPDERGRSIYTYTHPVLQFEARFVLTETSPVPHMERLDANFFDINFYVGFDIKLSNYACEIVLDMMEEICKRHKFYVYVDPPGIVYQFKRSVLLKYFQTVKTAYASHDNYIREIAQYAKLDSQTLTQVYTYMQKRKRLELTLVDRDQQNIEVTNYLFLHSSKSRTAYVSIKWDGKKAFILPPAVDILILDDGNIVKYIRMKDVLTIGEKWFRQIDGYGQIQVLDQKYVGKLRKQLVKGHFVSPSVSFELISLDKILDV